MGCFRIHRVGVPGQNRMTEHGIEGLKKERKILEIYDKASQVQVMKRHKSS